MFLFVSSFFSFLSRLFTVQCGNVCMSCSQFVRMYECMPRPYMNETCTRKCRLIFRSRKHNNKHWYTIRHTTCICVCGTQKCQEVCVVVCVYEIYIWNLCITWLCLSHSSSFAPCPHLPLSLEGSSFLSRFVPGCVWVYMYEKYTTQFMTAITNGYNNNCWIMFAISQPKGRQRTGERESDR